MGVCMLPLSPVVSLPSLDSYLTGVPLMSGVYARSQLQVLPTVPDPDQKRVEVSDIIFHTDGTDYDTFCCC